MEGEPIIDPAALAQLGIDYDAVVGRFEETFGVGALDDTHAACLGISPRAKRALAFAVDYAYGDTVLEDHLLLGILRVPESVASRVLEQQGVTLEAAEATRTTNDHCSQYPQRDSNPCYRLERAGA